VLQNRTLFVGITLLPPASCWTFVRGKVQSKSTYFDKRAWEQLPRLNEAEFYRRLKETFQRVVPKYFRGHRKIGMSLTGGLDGRMIMACRPSGTLPCYTFGSTYRDCTDVAIAREVARASGQTHEVIAVGDAFTAQFAAMAEKAIFVSDGAMDVTGAVELFVNQRAREIATVRMTGNYGSEVLRSNVAFKARPLSSTLFAPEVVQLGVEAAGRYAAEARCRPLSLIVHKQVPWHHHSRLAVEQSQVTMRSPYLDNNLVALAYQAPKGQEFSKTPALRFVHECNAVLGRIPTDRGLLYRPTPVLTRMQNVYREFTFRAEYAYDYGMPQWLARVDHHARAWAPERAFLGRHKFYHFRVWYRDSLRGYLTDVLLDPRSLTRQHVQPGSLERLLQEHLAGTRNNTTQLHQALSIELIHRQLTERAWH
jgi:asparagine synthase (glutamine-hydrolysing)